MTSAQIDGTSADNIIVGSGPGAQDTIAVFDSHLPALGNAPKVFASFEPFAHDSSGVNVAAGMVDLMSGRYSIVAAPGAGSPAVVKVFRLWLMQPIPGFPSQVPMKDMHQDSQGPITTASFAPFGAGYKGGVSLGVGWVAGSLGGAQSILAGQSEGGSVAVYSSGNALRGAPTIYMKDPQMHDYDVGFSPIARFSPFGSKAGVTVGTTATTDGADVLVSGLRGVNNVEVGSIDGASQPNRDDAACEAPKRGLDALGTQAQPLAGN